MSSSPDPSFSCSRDSVQKILNQHEKLLLIFEQPGCPPCDKTRAMIKEIAPDLNGISVAEVELGKGEMDCESLADEHQVEIMPTFVYYEKGQLKKKWTLSGDDQKDKADILRLTAQEGSFGAAILEEALATAEAPEASPPPSSA